MPVKTGHGAIGENPAWTAPASVQPGLHRVSPLGRSLVAVTEPPHTGCRKFMERFGPDAVRFVNSPEGRRLRLRGVNARVVERGSIRTGDRVKKR